MSNHVSKKDVIAEVATRSEETVKVTEKVVNNTFDVISEKMAEGQEVHISGFGNFKITERAERQGRNPATGAAITIPARKVPVFKPAKALKESVDS